MSTRRYTHNEVRNGGPAPALSLSRRNTDIKAVIVVIGHDCSFTESRFDVSGYGGSFNDTFVSCVSFRLRFCPVTEAAMPSEQPRGAASCESYWNRLRRKSKRLFWPTLQGCLESTRSPTTG